MKILDVAVKNVIVLFLVINCIERKWAHRFVNNFVDKVSKVFISRSLLIAIPLRSIIFISIVFSTSCKLL